ncbi:MAG: SPOR domain-containing protein [Flavobacteriales bacterium]
MRRGLLLSLLSIFLLTSFLAANPAICKRSFSAYRIALGQEIVVTVEINKGNITGIAKFVEEIPDGLTAYEGNSAATNGVFTFEQQKLKIVWLNVPKENIFKVTYKLRATGEIQKDYRIIGKFSYLVSEAREEFFLSEGVITGYSKADASLQASAAKSFVVENVVSASSTKVDSTSSQVQPVVKTEAPKVTTYKVQLGVFAAKKDPSVFKTLTDISDEEVAGKYKYYSGSFATKAEAEKRIEEAKKLGFSGAFVVPFVDGKRAN